MFQTQNITWKSHYYSVFDLVVQLVQPINCAHSALYYLSSTISKFEERRKSALSDLLLFT